MRVSAVHHAMRMSQLCWGYGLRLDFICIFRVSFFYRVFFFTPFPCGFFVISFDDSGD